MIKRFSYLSGVAPGKNPPLFLRTQFERQCDCTARKQVSLEDVKPEAVAMSERTGRTGLERSLSATPTARREPVCSKKFMK